MLIPIGATIVVALFGLLAYTKMSSSEVEDIADYVGNDGCTGEEGGCKGCTGCDED